MIENQVATENTYTGQADGTYRDDEEDSDYLKLHVGLVEVSQVLDDLVARDQNGRDCADGGEDVRWTHFIGVLLGGSDRAADHFYPLGLRVFEVVFVIRFVIHFYL
jgi:hypothetical protein